MKTLMAKPFWRSKTLWINVIGTLMSIGIILGDYTRAPWLVVIMGILNVINRFFTAQALTFKSN